MPTTPLLSQLESYLALSNKRQTVIASNMANVDTPGYHTEDLDFGREMKRALTNAGKDASETDTTAQVAVHAVKGLLERPDGNNVDLDRESMQLAQTQLQYGMGTQLLKQRFHQLLTAINGDK